MTLTRYAKFAWGVLAWNLLVIIWGAFVRASGSGAGCGDHWPLCNGELIPQPQQLETIIEFAHRITSGVALIGVFALVIGAWRTFPAGHRVRKAAGFSGLFIIVEALLGAGLVLLELVAYNVSIARAYWMAGHLVSTFMLVATLTLTAWWAGGGPPVRLRGHGPVGLAIWLAIAGMFVLGASGGITALGDTLAIGGGISPTENVIVGQIVGLRIYHPIIAFIVCGLVALAYWQVRHHRPAALPYARWALGLFVAQLLVGALNVALKAPVWLQLFHLLVTNAIWILVVLMAATAFAAAKETAGEPAPTEAGLGKPLRPSVN